MCMALCPVLALGPSYMLAVYESTAACIWDLRSPRAPATSIVLARDPQSPAICATVIWRRCWIACANGEIARLRIRGQDTLQKDSSSVKPSPAAYADGAQQDMFQA